MQHSVPSTETNVGRTQAPNSGSTSVGIWGSDLVSFVDSDERTQNFIYYFLTNTFIGVATVFSLITIK